MLPAFVAFKPSQPVPLDEIFKERASDDAVSFVSALLALNPERRLTAPAALEHSYFRRPPAATPPAQLPLGTNLIVRP
jgi:serine/threonine protein kinase